MFKIRLFVWAILICCQTEAVFGEEPAYWTKDFRYLAVDRSLHSELNKSLLWMECAKPIQKVLGIDQEWEKKAGFVNPTPASVFRDPQARYRMYYEVMKDNDSRWCAVAFSEDGLHWEKPRLGLTRGKFTDEDNNLIELTDTDWLRGPCVFYDPKAPEQERYKLSWRDNKNMYAAISSDGFRFRTVGKITDEGNLDSMNQTFRDPLTGKYTAYCRWWFGKTEEQADGDQRPRGIRTRFVPPARRGVSMKRSEVWACDWSGKRELILDPKDLFGEQGWTDLYTPCVTVYYGQYVAFPMLYLRYPLPDYSNTAGPLYSSFLYSRDGVRWNCPAPRHPLIDLRMHTGLEYEIGMAMAIHTMIEREGELLMYYRYDPGKHHIPDEERRGGEGEGIFAASLRKDGFGAVCSYPKEVGYWLTSEIDVPSEANDLYVNAIAEGEIRVEVRDAQNKPMDGFLFDGMNACQGDFIKQKLSWDQAGVRDLAGQTIRLCFELENAKIYSFWFE